MSSYALALEARIFTSITAEQLAKSARTEIRREDRPRTLRFKDIYVADQVFQWRIRDDNLAADIAHIRELARTIEDKGKPLDPILVTPVGKKFYVVDGHHRLEAYRLAKWRKEIPVTYFDGNIKEAQEEAWRRNYKNKLPMRHADKLEAAWRLVKEGSRTQSAISDLTTISVRTIATMAAVWKEHRNGVKDERWVVARSRQWNSEDRETKPGEDWVERKAHEWAQQIFKNLGPDALASVKADVFARALEIVNPELPNMLINEWREQAIETLGIEASQLPKDADGALEPVEGERGAWDDL
jgi:ParB-like nuclease family protein